MHDPTVELSLTYPPYFPQSLGFLIPRKGMSCMGRRLAQFPKQLQSHGRDGDVSRQMSCGARAERLGHHGESLNPPPLPPAVVQSHCTQSEVKTKRSLRFGGVCTAVGGEGLDVVPPVGALLCPRLVALTCTRPITLYTLPQSASQAARSL